MKNPNRLLAICLFISSGLSAQDPEIIAVLDSICVQAGEAITYNVTSNDQLPAGQDFPVFLLGESDCFELDFAGNLSFRDGAEDCCGEYLLRYLYEGCQEPSICTADIIITVKCEKPDCSYQDLSAYLVEDPTGGQNPDAGCLSSCEAAEAIYFVPYDSNNTYTWSVSGGSFVAGSNPAEIVVSWGSAGAGQLTLTITDAAGMPQVITICVDILTSPTADFSKSADTLCLNGTVYFTNNSINANSWFWDFGDGTTSNQYEPAHTYTAPGTYAVLLTVTQDNFGPDGSPSCCCSDTLSMDIVVDPLPGPEIYCISTLCAGDSTKYWTDASNCSTYTWTVLDADDLPVTFAGQGTDTICVTWGDGPIGQLALEVEDCDSAYCPQPVTAIVPIISIMTDIAGLTQVCENETAVYTAPKWPSVAYDWQVSGGTLLAGQGTHTISVQWGTAPGPGTITLNYGSTFLGGLPGQDPVNCTGSGNLSVAIAPAFELFGLTTVCAGTSSSFSATTTPSANYTWSVSPSVPFTGQGTSTINIDWNAGPGSYVVTVTPDDPTAYCNAMLSRVVTVVEIPPAAGITGEVEICPGGTDTYFGLASAPGVGFTWTVTGGTPLSFNGDPLVVNWNPTGPYKIELRQFGLSAPFCTSDSIELNLSPKVLNGPLVLTGPGACTNTIQTYTAGPAQHPDTDFQWTISPAGAGSIVSGQGTPSLMVQWNNTPGPITLSLTAELCGTTLSDNLSITLDEAVPPVITQTGILCPGGSATLDAGAGYVAYNWSTGATTQSIPITSGGNFVVTVTAANGCQAVATYQANEAEGPVASISSADPLVLCSNPPNNTGTVTINALTGAGYTYAWYCNGVLQTGIPASQPFLVHANTQTPTSFNYWVIVTDANGCTNQSNTITVVQSFCPPGGGGCQAEDYALSFTAVNQTPNCNVVDFTVSASPNVTLTAWDFNDPAGNTNTGTPPNAVHAYSQAGCYLVRLNATVPEAGSAPGDCVVFVTESVCVPLAADFTFTTNCLTADFCDASTFLAGENPISWTWNFGDGNTGAGAKPSHTYTANGTYTVTLTVTNANDCEAVWTEAVTVQGLPIATIGAMPNAACVGEAVQFNGSSAVNIISWLWDFGDGTSNGNQNPVHTYGTAGTYTVNLNIVDDLGCGNVISLPYTVFPALTPDTIAWSPSLDICAGDMVTLTAPLGPGYSYTWSTGATTPMITVGATGTYGVTVLDANDCELIPDPVEVTVYPLPPAVVSGPNVICDAGCIELSAPLGFGYTYQWYRNTGDPIIGATAPILSVCDTDVQSPYVLEVTDQNGCTNTSAPHPVSLETSPMFTINVLPDSCAGTLSTLTITPVQADVVYSWSTGETGTSINVLQAGTYTAVGRDTLTDCSTSASATIYPLPDLCLVPVGCYEVCNPDTICGPAGLAAYQWNQDGVAITGATEQCLIVAESGTYSLTGTTNFGCNLTTDSLILTVIDCECDALAVAAQPSPTDSCCWTLSYEHGYASELYGLQVHTDDADLNVNPGSIDPALMVVSTTLNSVSLTGAGGTTLPTGSLDDFMAFCFSNVQNTPQTVVIDWYDPAFDIVCSDTLFFACPVEPDCLYLQSDSIYCENGQVTYELTVCNPIDAAFPVAWIDLTDLSPPGIMVTPPAFDLTANPILAGDCRTLSVLLNGANIAGQEYCYNLIAHDQMPTVDTALCCSLDTLYCVTIPDCDPCDDIGIAFAEPLMEESGYCCYSVGLFNDFEDNLFDGISLCVLSPNTTISMDNPFGSGWVTTNYQPTVIDLMVSPPLGSHLPLGTVTLPDLCVQTAGAQEQLIEIKWLIGDSIACRDTLSVGCEPPCGFIQEEEILCNTALGGWTYSGVLKNTSTFTAGEAHLVFTSPAGLSIYDTTLPLGSLPPGAFFPFTLPIGAPAMSGDTVCFTVALHELGHDEGHVNCCNFSKCIVLPDCEAEAQCVCDDNFFAAVAAGIECLPEAAPSTYSFTPFGNLLDCDEVLWVVSTDPDSGEMSTFGTDTVSFVITSAAMHTVCMKVNRTTPDGETCTASVCKMFSTDDSLLPPPQDAVMPSSGPLPLVISPEIVILTNEKARDLPHQGLSVQLYPNPATDELTVTLDGNRMPSGVRIRVLNVLAEQVLAAPYPVDLASAQLKLDVSALSAGVYWVHVAYGEGYALKKLIVQ